MTSHVRANGPSHPRLRRWGATGLCKALLCIAVSFALPSAADVLLVKNATLITMAPGDKEAFAGYMVVGDDGRIRTVGRGDPPADLAADRVLDAEGKIVAPGFISAHSHLFMSPLRGLGHDVTLYGWFQAWSRYLRHATSDDIYWFTLHGSIDFLRNGITTAYDFTDAGEVEEMSTDPAIANVPTGMKPGPYNQNQFRAKLDAGIRFIDSVWISELGTETEIRERFETLLVHNNSHEGNPLYLKTAISGGQQFAPTARTAQREAEFMRRYGLINQSHFLESPDSIPAQQAKFAWYDDAGALGPNMIFGHFIHTNPAILQRVVETGSQMSWQPTSNGRLADGIADIVTYRRMGIPVAVGLDDQSCTDVSDPFQNLRIGLYTMRGLHKSATALSIEEMLYLHTLGSAKVLGIDKHVGSLEVGKFADFLLVDLRDPDTGPIHEALASYVLASSLRNLKQVYVGGRLVADGTRITTVDEARIRGEIDTRLARIKATAVAADAERAARQ
jgi:cytosine/adenosine deaminase-related metal-dependent hydrolase